MSNISISKEVPITGLVNESDTFAVNTNEPVNYIMGYNNSLDNNKNTKEIGNQNHSMSNTVERVIINPDTRSSNDSPSLNNIKLSEDLVLKLNQEIHQSLLPSNLENTIVNNIEESSRREVSPLDNSVYPIQNVNSYLPNEFDDLKSIQNQNKDYMKTSFRMKKNDSSNNNNTGLFLKKVVNALLNENNEKPKSLINPVFATSKSKSISNPGLSTFYTFSSHNTSNGMKSSVSSTLSSPSIENAVISSPINKQNNKGSSLSFPFLSFKSLFSSEGKNKSEPTTHGSSSKEDDKNSSFLPNQSIKNLKEIQSRMEHNQSSSSKGTSSSKPSKSKKSSFNSKINFQSFLNVFNNLSDYAKSQESEDNEGQGNKKKFVASTTATLNVPGANELSHSPDQDLYGHSIPTSSPLMASLPLLSNGNSYVVLPPLSRRSSVSRHSSFSYHIPQQPPHYDNDNDNDNDDNDDNNNDNDNDNIHAKLPPTSLSAEKENKIDKSNAYSSSNSSSNNSNSVESDVEINSPRFYNQSLTGKPICIPYKASSLSPNIQYADIAPQNKFLSSIIQTRDRSNSVSSCSSFSSIKDTLNIDTIHEEHEGETEEDNKSKPIYRSSSLRPPNKTYKSATIPIIISNDTTAPSAPVAPAAPAVSSNINIQDRKITRHKKYYSQSSMMNPPAYIHHSIPAYNTTSTTAINRERNNSMSRGPFSYSNIFSSSNLNQVNSLASDDDSEDEKVDHTFIKSSASLISSLVNAEAEKKDDQKNKSSVFDPEFIERVRAKAVMQHRQSILFHDDKKFVMEPCSFNSIIPEPEKLRLLNPVFVRNQYLEQLHSGTTRPMTLKEIEQKGAVSPDQILDTITAEKLRFHLPRRYRDHPTWELIYSLSDHGYSFLTVYDKIADKGPLLLVIKDTQDQVFGAYLSESVRVSNRFYGSGECFLWRKGDNQRPFKVYEWSGLNELNMLTSRDTIAFGGGKQGRFGLSLDQDMEGGTTAYCDTFRNDPLTISSKVDRFKPQTLPTYYETPNITFECVNIEFWKITDEECRCSW